MQPHSAKTIRRKRQATEVILNGFCNQRRNFLEYFAPLLDKQFIRLTNTGFVCPVQEAEIIADVVREGRFQAGTKNLKPLSRLSVLLSLHKNSRAGITKNKMTVAIAEIQVAGADFRADNQYRAR